MLAIALGSFKPGHKKLCARISRAAFVPLGGIGAAALRASHCARKSDVRSRLPEPRRSTITQD
jgi:hypothetical protein